VTRHYYRARLVGAGPYVGVMVWRGLPFVDGEEVDRSPRWQALVGTEKTARAILMGDELPIEVDGVTLRNLERISEQDYQYLVAHADWAKQHAPSMPDASPRQKVDLKRMPSIF
jgi:hypothetical protein